MKRILLGLLFALAPFGAYAQTASAVVVSSCGTPPTTYTAGQLFPLTVDTTGKLCDGGGSGGSTNPIYVVPTAANASKTDISMTLTAGGTAQQVMAAGSAGAVRHILIQNLSADPYGCSFTTTTPVVGAVGTFILKAATSTTSGDGGSYSTPPGLNDNQALYCIAATTGDKLFGISQ